MDFTEFDNKYLSPKEIDEAFKYFKNLNKNYKLDFKITGHSTNNLPIKLYQVGSGKIVILIFSQIHGNEPTSTRGLLIFLDQLLKDSSSNNFLEKFTFIIIPQLNIDGVIAYSRHNHNDIDINRDAVNNSQIETDVLKNVISDYKCDYCFSLHDQRNFYVVGKDGQPSSLSFKVAFLDEHQSVNQSVIKSMQIIADMVGNLNQDGVYLSRFNENYNSGCFGEYISSLDINYILFEAGFKPFDYLRKEPALLIALALENALKSIIFNTYQEYDSEDYFNIPLNEPEYVDLIMRNCNFKNIKELKDTDLITFIFKEELIDGKVVFYPNVIKREHYPSIKGYYEIDLDGIKS